LPVDGDTLVMQELFRERIHLAVPEFHVLVHAEKVMLKRVSDERLLILKDGHCLRDETLTGFGVSLVPEMARLRRDCLPTDPDRAEGRTACGVCAVGEALCVSNDGAVYRPVTGFGPGPSGVICRICRVSLSKTWE
jgi:DNA-binding transcriptional LysR family regulator